MKKDTWDRTKGSVFASDLAALLGLNNRTLQRWIARGLLPGFRIGRPGSRLHVRALDFRRFCFSHPAGGRMRRVVAAFASPFRLRQPSDPGRRRR